MPEPTIHAFCMKCHVEVPMHFPVKGVTKKGVGILRDKCQTCGTTIVKFLPGKKVIPDAIAPAPAPAPPIVSTL